jgi:hypothetical protein
MVLRSREEGVDSVQMVWRFMNDTSNFGVPDGI